MNDVNFFDLFLIGANYILAVYGAYVFFIPWPLQTPCAIEWLGNIMLMVAVLGSISLATYCVYRKQKE